jgi:hypothetical protein
MEGVLWNGEAVLFSSTDGGAAPTLPVTYSIPDACSHAHFLVNMSGLSVAVTADKTGTCPAGSTNVTVSTGGQYAADEAGVIRFSD